MRSSKIIQFFLFSFWLVLAGSAGAQNAPDLSIQHLTGPDGNQISGNLNTVYTGENLLLRVKIFDASGTPIAGIPVSFHQVTPSEKMIGKVDSDDSGIAEILFTAGKKADEYTVLATIDGPGEMADSLILRIPVRNSTWVMFMIFGLAGGLGLFLYGMDMMSGSFQRTAGGRLRGILRALTYNRVVGVLAGALVTAVMQSSSATTVMLVSFVQAQLMTFSQTLGVILGADIGTTLTTQLIAFKLTDYALLMIAVGFGLKIQRRYRSLRSVGEMVLGFGILFYGMFVMSAAMYPLRSYQPFLSLLQNLENPILGILVGTIFTALIQSSAAFAGIVIVLAQQGLVSLEAAIPLIFGANIGTCITAALASINTGRQAKRVALAHTAFKLLGVLLMVGWIPAFANFVRGISPLVGQDVDPALVAENLPRQIANAHTIFNVGLALAFLPFTGVISRVVEWVLPDVEEEEEFAVKARFLDRSMLVTPSLALNLAKVEIIRLGEHVMKMTESIIHPFFETDLAVLDRLHDMEEEVDALDKQITHYLIDIGKQNLGEGETEEVYLMMNVCKQYEHIADIIDKELRPLAQKRITKGVSFSQAGTREVQTYHLKVIKQIARGLEAFREGSLVKAKRMTKKQSKYVALEGSYRQSHFERIRERVTESIATSGIHLDLMDGLQKINSYSTNIARAMLAQDQEDGSEDQSTWEG